MVGLVVVMLVVLSAAAFWVVRSGLPDYEGTQTLPGLTADVTVVRDEYAIPTIYAGNAEDLFRAQGYTHAQDRFFEMDVRRKVVAGRTAEMFGEDAVETDTFLRTLGWRAVAEEDEKLLTPQSRRYYEAYAQGVNAWLNQHSGMDRGLGPALLGVQNSAYEPEPWTVADSIGWYMALAWDLSDNRPDEVTRSVLAETLPVNRIDQLYPPTDFDRFGSILSAADLAKSGLQRRSAPPSPPALPQQAQPVLSAASAALNSLRSSASSGFGSNSWTVGPGHTASGGAVLANDTHLAPTVPGIFTQTHLRCAPVSEACPFDVAGFGFSGAPGVFIGHNEDVAWGLTSPYVDVADLYLEKVAGNTYVTEDGSRPIRTRQETIEVAGGEPVEIEVRSTRHGPLISDAGDDEAAAGRAAPVPAGSPERLGGYAVALRWIGLEPSGVGNAIFAMNQAAGWEEFTAAVKQLAKPSQNILYADREGNVGYYLNGLVPVRKGYDGRWPVPGWSGEYDWRGFIPFQDLPHVLNPEAGFVVTANDSIVDETYPYPLGEYRYAYRGDRIRDELSGTTTADPESMVELQMDDFNRNAEFLVPYLLSVDGLPDYYDDGQELLADWDLEQPVDSAAAAYFAAVWARILELTFHDELPEGHRPTGRARWFEVVRDLAEDPGDAYWDDIRTLTEVETRDDILLAAMRAARDDLTRLINKDPERWEWGAIHSLELAQIPFGESGIGPVEQLFNRGPYPTGGGGDLIQATSWDADKGFTITNAPAQRMVVDFGNLDSSVWVNLTGQSEHPFGGHYTDQVELWRTGGTIPMPWSDDTIAERAAYTMVLTAGESSSLE